MRLLLLTLCLAMGLALTGCGAAGDPMPPLLDIPKPPNPVDARQRGDHMLVSWPPPTETTEGVAPRPDRLGPVKIYRVVLGELRESFTEKDFEKPVEIKSLPPGTTEFQEPIDPAWINHTVLYAVSYTNRRGETAGLTRPGLAAVLTVASAPVVKSEVTELAVKLSWSAPAETSYRVYRDGAAIGDTASGSFDDTHFEFDHTYTYVVRALAHNGKFEAESDDSKPVAVTALDTFAPLSPQGLRALAVEDDRGKSVDLSWSPNTEADLAGYNIYRGSTKLNEKLSLNTVFHDPAPGNSPRYRITAVDTHGNESKPSEEAMP